MDDEKRIDLGGSWHMTYFQEGTHLCAHPDDLTGISAPDVIPATVPGNIVLDLWKAGIIDDPYIRMNAIQLRAFESYEWWFQREFRVPPEFPGNVELVLEGLDCYGSVWLNGRKVGDCANAFIPHAFDAGPLLQSGVNTITVRIASSKNAATAQPVDAESFSHSPYTYEALRMRSPAHAWGWDIAPRMALGGIWKEVYLRAVPQYEFGDWYVQTLPGTTAERADLILHYNFRTSDTALSDYSLRLSGTCGAASFQFQWPVWSCGGAFRFTVDEPRLWWPRGYGRPDLYDLKLELCRRGDIVAAAGDTLGIRTVQLLAKPLVTELDEPDFQFIINGEPVFIKGSNWVPADALHSRDAERIPQILEMAADLNCNMLRVWGGGTYESHLFYDICDREGIMIWQDFMMGCMKYPQDKEFRQVIRHEAEVIIKKLRRHPCIVLWAGDNECDMACTWSGYLSDPNRNMLTRQVLPEALQRHDPTRPYLPSSPWISPEAYRKYRETNSPSPYWFSPEQHLWGPRDYFRSDFYRNTTASFVSEIGYHGCPGVGSIQKFVSPQRLWPLSDNPEWDYHASNPFYGDHDQLNYRTALMANQVREMFGTVPGTLEEFVLASQICQAEAKKFFIELVRGRKGKMSGILWWNLMDCWPQFSDAIVDYYFNRKLAYYYIRRLQQPVLVMLEELKAWQQEIVILNDSLAAVSGNLSISDADDGEILWEGDFQVGRNSMLRPGGIRISAGSRRMLFIHWQLSDGTTGVNHCLCGFPPFDLVQYRGRLKKIAGLDNSFDAGRVGR